VHDHFVGQLHSQIVRSVLLELLPSIKYNQNFKKSALHLEYSGSMIVCAADTISRIQGLLSFYRFSNLMI